MLHGAQICRGALMVSHLFFADDNIVFGSANGREIDVMKGVLETYEETSGQSINLSKSDIYFSGRLEENRLWHWLDGWE